jgi:hypothetical protein
MLNGLCSPLSGADYYGEFLTVALVLPLKNESERAAQPCVEQARPLLTSPRSAASQARSDLMAEALHPCYMSAPPPR